MSEDSNGDLCSAILTKRLNVTGLHVCHKFFGQRCWCFQLLISTGKDQGYNVCMCFGTSKDPLPWDARGKETLKNSYSEKNIVCAAAHILTYRL